MTKITKKNYKGGSVNVKYPGFCDNHPTQCLEMLKNCGGSRHKKIRKYKKSRLNHKRKSIKRGGSSLGFQTYPGYCDGKTNWSQCGISSGVCNSGGKFKKKKNKKNKKSKKQYVGKGGNRILPIKYFKNQLTKYFPTVK